MRNKLVNENFGFELLKVTLKEKGDDILQVLPRNKGLHKLVYSKNSLKYYYVFKDQPFHKADFIFHTNYGEWESLNVECLEYALQYNYLLLFGYADGKIYIITARRFKEVQPRMNEILPYPKG